MTSRKQPWWRATDSLAWMATVAGLWLLIAAGQWWRLADDADPSALRIILPILSSGVAIVQSVATVRLWREKHEKRTSVGQFEAGDAAADHRQD